MDLSTKTVRELIVELTHTEDALRGDLPVVLPAALRERVLARQEEICAELRRRSSLGQDVPVLTETAPGPEAPLPEPA
jgi:hypothetical protein